MGRSYTDIKYDLWYQCEQLGISIKDISVAIMGKPGSKIFSYSCPGVVGSATEVNVKNNKYFFNSADNTITFPIYPTFSDGFFFSAHLVQTSRLNHGGIFDTKRGFDWGKSNGLGCVRRSDGGWVIQVGVAEAYHSANDFPLNESAQFAGHWIPSVCLDTYKNGQILDFTSKIIPTTVDSPNYPVMLGAYYNISSYRLIGSMSSFIIVDGKYAKAPSIIQKLADPDKLFSPHPDIAYFDMAQSGLLPIKLTFKDQLFTTYRKYSTTYRNPITTLSNKSAVFAPAPEPSTFNSSWALGSNVILQPGVIT